MMFGKVIALLGLFQLLRKRPVERQRLEHHNGQQRSH